MMSNKEKIKEYLEKTKGFSAEEIIKFAYQEFGAKVMLASSLGEEDQAITNMIARHAPQIEVFTLDTGRLFPETYELLAKTQKKYSLTIKVYYPDTAAVEKMVQEKGINLFYESVENRKFCCHVRKVEPLKRALENVDAWICGLRRTQSVTRSDIEAFEWDEVNQKIKINPVVDWNFQRLHEYIRKNNVDISPLHCKGFLSIGCACCTRAVQEGEDIRAGRWWWEDPEKKECGLHNNPNRKERV